VGKRDLFAAAKKLKTLSADAVLAKATGAQRAAVRINESLVRFHMSKVWPSAHSRARGRAGGRIRRLTQRCAAIDALGGAV